MTVAGTRPRSLTVWPFARAQDLSSALLTLARSLVDLIRTLLPPRASLPLWPGRGERPRARLGFAALSEVISAGATDKVTSYAAPTTRRTSSRGSLESMLIFTDLDLRCSSPSAFRADRTSHGRTGMGESPMYQRLDEFASGWSRGACRLHRCPLAAPTRSRKSASIRPSPSSSPSVVTTRSIASLRRRGRVRTRV